MKGMMQPRNEEEGMQQTMDIIVQHQKMSDVIHEKFGVDEEEFTKSIQHYSLMTDPEVQDRMRQSFANMPPEFMQGAAAAMGGQGGGQGMGGGMGF
jgi:hypothetical protein